VSDSDPLPIFRSETYAELGAFLSERVPPESRSQIVFEPSSADELPGRRILLGGEALCRVVPDPSDPRPLPSVIHRWIETAAAAVVPA
jgi:hypothetical protein